MRGAAGVVRSSAVARLVVVVLLASVAVVFAWRHRRIAAEVTGVLDSARQCIRWVCGTTGGFAIASDSSTRSCVSWRGSV